MKNSIGARIRYFREAAGLTQTELARRLGTTKQHIWRWERNQVSPTTRYIRSLSQSLGVSAADLLGTASPQELSGEEHQFIRAVRSHSGGVSRLLDLVPLVPHLDDESWGYLIRLMKKLHPSNTQ